MTWKWGELARKSRKWLRMGWLGFAVLVAFYVGMVEPRNRYRGISESKATGLAAGTFGDPVSLWQSHSQAYLASGSTFSQARVAPMRQAAMFVGGITPDMDKVSADRKLIRTAALDVTVKNPAGAAEKIRQIAEQAGGFLVSSQINPATGAAMTIRVPVARFEEVRAEIRKLSVRVESDRLEAQDTTRDYVDREARLRNLRAQEQQYLAILKRAATVKDTLEVSEKLDDVRTQIETQQAEFDALSKQVETVAVSISLTTEADAQVFGLQWRPLYRLKVSAREGLDGVGDYVASITAFVFYLPTILLWLATFLVGAAVGWRILRWSVRLLFAGRQPAATETGAD